MRQIAFALCLSLFMGCGEMLPAGGPPPPGLPGSQMGSPGLDVAHAGKKETADFIARTVPPSLSWNDAHWNHSVTQTVAPTADPCVISFRQHFKDDRDDGDNSREDDAGGSVQFGTSAIAQYLTGQTGDSTYLGPGGNRDMTLYWPKGPERQALAAAMDHLQTLCALLAEPP